MSGVTTRLALPEDAADIARMLGQLADDLGDGDIFSSTAETIHQHGFGPDPMFHSVIAEKDGRSVGLALFFRHFSTTRAQPGTYVQDLWVHPETRGVNVGQHLLTAVAKYGAVHWQASYIALSVHVDNARATQFYQRLGFEAHTTDRPMALKGQAFQDLLNRGASGQ